MLLLLARAWSYKVHDLQVPWGYRQTLGRVTFWPAPDENSVFSVRFPMRSPVTTIRTLVFFLMLRFVALVFSWLAPFSRASPAFVLHTWPHPAIKLSLSTPDAPHEPAADE